MNQTNLWQLFYKANQMLRAANQNEQISQWILEKYLPVSEDWTTYLFNHRNDQVSFGLAYLTDIQAYIDGKPLARILKKTRFYGLDLIVDDEVFCPRNETELLVEQALEWIQNHPNAESVCDIGVGSGAIITAVAYHASHLKAYGNDLNPKAIYCTYKNATNHQCNVNLMLGSNLKPYLLNEIKINCLIANPPYIDYEEKLEAGVTQYDPELALFAPQKGLASYLDIIENAHLVLKKPYVMLFEIGYQQANEICQILIKNGFEPECISVIQDYQGWDRIIKVVSHV